MRLNIKELQKILYDFNSISNRLLQADYQDYTGVLRKFLKYIDDTPIINEYIADCGDCDLDIEEEVNEVQISYGRTIFYTGDTDEEEVRNVYAVLRYIVESNNCVYFGLATGYSHSKKYQDKIKGFNDRFVMVLIRHIERYLTKVGIDMGLDERNFYNVTVHKGQVVIANDNSTVTATNEIGYNIDELQRLLEDVQTTADDLPTEDKEAVAESLEVIKTEVTADKPKKSLLKTALNTLKSIKGITEFGAAVAALSEFIGPILLNL